MLLWRRSWPAFPYAKIINALQINPLNIDASSYIIDTLCVMILSPCQEVPLKRGLDSLYSSEDNRKSLSISELRLSSRNTSLPRGSGVYTIERGMSAKKWPRFHALLKMYLTINNLHGLLWRRPAPPDHDVPHSSLAGLRPYLTSVWPCYRMTPSAVILIFTSDSPFSSSITNHSPEGVSMYSASSIFQDG